jgi:hypothetical protein
MFRLMLGYLEPMGRPQCEIYSPDHSIPARLFLATLICAPTPLPNL